MSLQLPVDFVFDEPASKPVDFQESNGFAFKLVRNLLEGSTVEFKQSPSCLGLLMADISTMRTQSALSYVLNVIVQVFSSMAVVCLQVTR